MDLERIKKAFDSGKPIIMLDTRREIEGDFIIPAEKADSEIINFMLTVGKGVLCAVGDEEEIIRKGFFKLPANSKDPFNTNWFIPIDAKETKTGITSSERALTIKNLSGDDISINDFAYPGHVQLLGSKGINKRQGHTEASVEIVEASGYKRFAAIIEILDENGDSHNLDYIKNLSEKYDIPLINIDDILTYSIKTKLFVRKASEATLPTKFGNFKITGFENFLDNQEHFLISIGELSDDIPLPVRIHSECVTGDVFHSEKCDCGSQLEHALHEINTVGRGIIIYLRQEGRGIGITNKIKAYALQEKGYDTLEANTILGFEGDARDYAVAAQMLKELKIKNIELLSNNPDKEEQMIKYGINVVKTRQILGEETKHNSFYLKTKLIKFNHKLEKSETI